VEGRGEGEMQVVWDDREAKRDGGEADVLGHALKDEIFAPHLKTKEERGNLAQEPPLTTSFGIEEGGRGYKPQKKAPGR